ncbi:glycine betaine ABC transporter substrate-binding protein [Stigmatella aurantiaca]|uniref:ABC-type proline/glycine betaine transport system, periplasmic component n=2 Tax=Stigmatella aurantiaca (strain DW4/3-1) TaxID=378806 RepID=E3FKS4_STIAD|nr:glycine betaine ABC transporter substrate-binding protein [Stigmatella aurantiaca]ADO69242.1 ABC-type proline/glycine betaine transport system, periplasmic component [Stigmatella aurantiaca DW4/3-1]
MPGLHLFARMLVAIWVGLLPVSAWADDCTEVRIADVGWTDVTATTALAGEVLHDLGYKGRVELLSLPVTFMGLRNGDIDVFLGNWMPAQADAIQPHLNSGEVVDLGVNLEGALYTFAVPAYVSEAGIKSAADLAAHQAEFKGRIHGIAPGSAANRMVLSLIQQNTYGLKDWTLVESSEQGMLGEVRRAVASGEWIVFFGWKPHPMNSQLSMQYLDDPLETWGPGGGASVVHTVANKGFVERCPNLAKLFQNMKFTTAIEGELMGRILDEKLSPGLVAREWLRAHADQAAAWTRGVRPASAMAGEASPRADVTEPAGEPAHKLPLGDWLERVIRFITAHFTGELRAISRAVTWLLESSVNLLLRIPPLVLIGATALVTYALRRGLALAVAIVAGGLLIWDLGYWQPTMETLVLVLVATALSLLLGVPLGIVAARRPRFYAVLRLLLDLMQTIPTFVYLIPTLMLFGLGVVPGLLSTVVFVLPAPIRLTYLGITSVPKEMIEAGEAFGARPLQLLVKIELPYARKAILEGVTQALMLSLSMVVIAALVGAGGLGSRVVRALNTVDIRQGFEAGLVIVILAILLDRMFKHPAPQRPLS